MTADDPITNTAEVIDSREVIERIRELEALQADEPLDEVDAAELASLHALAEVGAQYSEDWPDGATLIRDSHFVEYAKDLADDLGMIDNEAKWPARHIDWEAAADELKGDYTEITFDGAQYWIR